ncbi:MAG TPA: LysR substrate-binding domain-containing protein [Planctomycetota bacterium]|nr:LysR substrate-binding domain-containing protein [Planctomycetota bacterium]
MELHQLRYFVAVADAESFTRAAEKCFVTQPSLSQQVIKLEKELGHSLLERLGRRVRLTDPGRAFYEQAVSILGAVDEAKRRLSESGDSGQGTIRVGSIPTVAPYLLPPVLKRFQRAFARAAVVVHEGLTAEIVKGCVAGELDLGVVALPIAEPRLEVEALFTEELLVAMPPGHPFARRRRVTVQDLTGEPFILLSETHCLGEQVVSFCNQQSCQPLVTCKSAQLLTVQELVGVGHGISLIPAMARELDRSRRRRYRSLSGARPVRTLAMIRHRQRYQSPLAEGLARAVREHARQFQRPGKS